MLKTASLWSQFQDLAQLSESLELWPVNKAVTAIDKVSFLLQCCKNLFWNCSEQTFMQTRYHFWIVTFNNLSRGWCTLCSNNKILQNNMQEQLA